MLDKRSYFKCVDLANQAIRAYYGGYSNPEMCMSDAEYDELMAKIREYEEAHPGEMSTLSPTRRIGMPVSDDAPAHLTKMYSMDNVYNHQQMERWLNKFSNEKVSFSVMPKYDGCAVNLIYINGKLRRILCRGDGLKGFDVYSNIDNFKNIPLELPNMDSIELEVRGELVISNDEFNRINNVLLDQYGPDAGYSNPRNFVAGAIHKSNLDDISIKFYPWGIGFNKLNLSTYEEQMELLSKYFEVEKPTILPSSSVSGIQSIYDEYVKERREKLPINIDGLVIRVNELPVCDKFGFTIRSPKFMVAYKFPPKVKIAKLLFVTEQMGRTGVITPVANISPTEIDGVTITKVTLHNYDYIKLMDYKIGDYVKVTRSGDVIPKIIGREERDENLDYTEILPPARCGCCFGPLTKYGAYLQCRNLDCSGKLKMRINHFVSKKGMNIMGLGPKLIDQLVDWLVDYGGVKDFTDIYNLDYEKLKLCYGPKEKMISNILNAIEKSKNVKLANFIYALGIDGVGYGTANAIANKYGLGWVNIRSDRIFDNLSLGMFVTITDYLKDNMDMITKLYSILNIDAPMASNINGPLKDVTFVITGTLSKPREYFEGLIRANGGVVGNNVSARTNYLICGDKPGSSKLERANELGVKVIDEKEFNEWF